VTVIQRVGVARLGDHLVLGAQEGQRGHPRGDVSQGGLAVGVVALAAPLDDVDVVRLVGHHDSVLKVEGEGPSRVYRRYP